MRRIWLLRNFCVVKCKENRKEPKASLSNTWSKLLQENNPPRCGVMRLVTKQCYVHLLSKGDDNDNTQIIHSIMSRNLNSVRDEKNNLTCYHDDTKYSLLYSPK